MTLIGKPHDAAVSPLMLSAVPTTMCCGLLTLRGAVQLVGFWTMFEGLCQLGTWMPDFAWGPPTYDWALQYVSFCLGLVSISMGVVCLVSSRSLHLGSIRRVKSFRRFLTVWTVSWFMLVGLPAEVVYKEILIVDVWPLSKVPGLPVKVIIDPDWPRGRPHVCGDICALRTRVLEKLKHSGNKFVMRQLMKTLYSMLFKVALPCARVVKLFWVWMASSTAVAWFCAIAMTQFEKVVMNGGDGVMMIGDVSDLSKPISEREVVKHQVKAWFDEVDEDGDGRVSFEEMMHFLEGKKVVRMLSKNRRGAADSDAC